MTASGYFITGTDTGVGKTLVSCALIHAFADRGHSVIGMKPVAAGATLTAEGLLNDDVARMRACANVTAPLSLVNPYCFALPVAPHLAARHEGVDIDLEVIVSAHAGLAAAADVVVVEGVGGFCVPLSRRDDSADLASRLALPVILVVGLRLGCLNHALLTAQAIRSRGLSFAGWVCNRIDPAMAFADENRAALAERIAAPLLGDIEHAPQPEPRLVAARLELSCLRDLA